MKSIILHLLIIFSLSLSAQDTISKPSLSYGNKGWELKAGDHYLMQLQWRFQFRFVTNSDDISFFINDDDNENGSFNIQRARIKVGGYAYQPYMKYYIEYDFPSNNLLNWEFTFSKFKAIQFKVGQWKINYNTERFVSSGKQQFVDRSIANRYFTFDRQIGVMVQGNIFDKKIAASNYYIGVFNGSGRGIQNENSHYLIMGRYQWNFSKKTTKMFFSDLEKVKKAEGFIALSAVQNESPYTSFSSSGGGSLPGYEQDSANDQFRVQQLGVELFLKYKGFSFMSENHIKNIHNLSLSENSSLYGGYVMAGYFLHQAINFVPKPLELNVRYALIQDKSMQEVPIHEYTAGINWFFKGHRNKLSLDVSLLENQSFIPNDDIYQLRLQWDVSF